MKLVEMYRRIAAGRMLVLIAASGGASIVMILLALEAGICADRREHWFLKLAVGSWVNLALQILVLTGLSLLMCVVLSWLSRGVRGGRLLSILAAFSVGATAWVMPAAIVMTSAYALGAGPCSAGFFRIVLIVQGCAICIGIASVLVLVVMAISSAWRRSRA